MKKAPLYTALLALLVSMSFSTENSVKKHLVFKANTPWITEETFETLDLWLQHIENEELEGVHITGFADPMTTEENTRALAAMRAHNIKHHLAENGLDENKIEISYKNGTTVPADEMPEGFTNNIRAEVELFFKTSVPPFFLQE